MLLLEVEGLRERCARGRTAELEESVRAVDEELCELRQRKLNNMGATKRLSLELRRIDVLKKE
eukprot:3328512-Prymnesium_polylepis.2